MILQGLKIGYVPSCVGSEEHEWEVIDHWLTIISLFPHGFPQKFRQSHAQFELYRNRLVDLLRRPEKRAKSWGCPIDPVDPVDPVAGRGFKIRLAMVSPKFDDLHLGNFGVSTFGGWNGFAGVISHCPVRLPELVKAGCWSRGRRHSDAGLPSI